MTTSRRTRALSLAAAACLLLAACSSDQTDSTDASASTDAGDQAADTDTTTAQDGAVRMADTAFAPAAISVTPGSTVTWTNDDAIPHTVSFSDDGPQSSDTIDPDATFEATFEEAGSYAYVCTLHPGMEGVVEVADEAAASPGPADNAAAATSHAPAPADGTRAQADAAPLPGVGTPGVDITLGEWALVPSVEEAPPGTTTFRFRNRGTVRHALRIRTPGSGGDRREWRSETVGPGESGLLVADLPPGTYEVDCPVEGADGEHDQLGMEMLFTVRDGAAALAPLPDAAGAADAPDTAPPGPEGPAVSVAGFAFAPAELRVPVGTAVAWTNRDPTPHTATGDGFDTGTLDQGATGTVTFDTAGTYDYVCAIHPTMQGRVVVEA